MTHPMDPFSMRHNGFGYYLLDPKYKGQDFRHGQKPISPKQIEDFTKFYFLNGCDTGSFYEPGTEPQNFKFFWLDNTLIPQLRYKSVANQIAHKFWHRITYCGWNMPEDVMVDQKQRYRVNSILYQESNGKITDIEQLWGGVKGTKPLTKKKALVVPSSEKNHRDFYDETPTDWIKKIVVELERQGFDYVVRNKQHVNSGQRIPEFYSENNCDLIIGQHTAAVVEVGVMGSPVVVTSELNPFYMVATPWKEFCQNHIRIYDENEIQNWLTKACGYTYYRSEIDSLKFIDNHPEAEVLRGIRYGI